MLFHFGEIFFLFCIDLFPSVNRRIKHTSVQTHGAMLLCLPLSQCQCSSAMKDIEGELCRICHPLQCNQYSLNTVFNKKTWCPKYLIITICLLLKWTWWLVSVNTVNTGGEMDSESLSPDEMFCIWKDPELLWHLKAFEPGCVLPERICQSFFHTLICVNSTYSESRCE